MSGFLKFGNLDTAIVFLIPKNRPLSILISIQSFGDLQSQSKWILSWYEVISVQFDVIMTSKLSGFSKFWNLDTAIVLPIPKNRSYQFSLQSAHLVTFKVDIIRFFGVFDVINDVIWRQNYPDFQNFEIWTQPSYCPYQKNRSYQFSLQSAHLVTFKLNLNIFEDVPISNALLCYEYSISFLWFLKKKKGKKNFFSEMKKLVP